MDNTEPVKKQHSIFRAILKVVGVIGVVYLLLALLATALLFFQIKQAMKWSQMEIKTQEARDRYAALIMMPEMSGSVSSVSIRGIRDPEYRIETGTYDSIEELYAILPFKNEEDRQEAVRSVGLPAAVNPEGLYEDDTDVYQAVGLPVTEEDKEGKVLAYYYGHSDYIVRNADGYRFVFFVQTI